MLLRSRSRYHDLLMAGAGQQVTALMERDGLEEAVVLRGEAQIRGARALGLPLVLEGAQGVGSGGSMSTQGGACCLCKVWVLSWGEGRCRLSTTEEACEGGRSVAA